jgi:hypothetical protein
MPRDRSHAFAVRRSDDSVEDRERAEGEATLDTGTEVSGSHRRSVRVADAVAKLNGIRPPVVRRRRQAASEVGYEPCAGGASDPPIGDEAVVDETGNAEVGHVRPQGENRVRAAALGRLRRDLQDAAAVALERHDCRRIDRAACQRDPAGTTSEGHCSVHVGGAVVDPLDGVLTPVGDPDAVRCCGERRRVPPHREGRRHAVRRGIYA